MTGDLVPHNIWNTDVRQNIETINVATAAIRKYFPKTQLIPVLGNHDVHPVNLWVSIMQILPDTVQNSMKVWFSLDLAHQELQPNFPQITSILPPQRHGQIGFHQNRSIPFSMPDITTCGSQRNSGSLFWIRTYAIAITCKKSFRAYIYILLNYNLPKHYLTKYFVLFRWQVYQHRDPGGQLQWLTRELHKSEERGELVHILGHVPPSQEECWTVWSRNFYRIINR